MRLFDKIGYTQKSTADTRRLADTHALYVLEQNTLEASRAIFADMGGEALMPLLYLPLPLICLEWIPPAGFLVEHKVDGSREMKRKVRLCAVLELSTEEVNGFKDQANMNLIYIALGVEIDGKLAGFSTAFVGCTSVNGKIPWDYTASNGTELEVHETMWARVIDTVVCALAFINSPNLCESEKVDLAKLNKKRVGLGRQKLSNYTVIRPNSDTRKWVRDKAESEKPGVAEHWVKAHRHTYLTGPGRSKAIVKLLAPFKRGDPEVGVREPRYVVKGN